MNYKVLITTSGLGQRLGELTKYTNKSLVRVGKKPSLSYIIESYPKDAPLVITVGVFGEQVRDFTRLAYPDRTIEFIDDQYDPELSSLGRSMLKAREYLQCPFIYHACDTIVNDPIPLPDRNWVGGCAGDDVSQYASFKVSSDRISTFGHKGAADFDYIHIGLIGINDYKKFWKALFALHNENPKNKELGDFPALIKMHNEGVEFKLVNFPSWIDIGNMAALKKARENIGDHFDNLDKVDESIFIFNDFVIKFFHDAEHVKNRVERARILGDLVPEIEGVAKNFYRYKYVRGERYSDVATPSDFKDLLVWAKQNLWHEHDEVSSNEFKDICRDFYYFKTKERIDKFLTNNNMSDEAHIINCEAVPPLADIIAKIDFDWLSDVKQRKFHGDFILENIIKTTNGFTLVDWRQNFGGLLHSGDMYYDLAKLNHNLVINHDVINKNLFSVKIDGSGAARCDIMRKENLVICQKTLADFIKNEGYDLKKVEVLTSLIWLNMSPLHHHPFNLFLYYFGKLNLWRAIGSLDKA